MMRKLHFAVLFLLCSLLALVPCAAYADDATTSSATASTTSANAQPSTTSATASTTSATASTTSANAQPSTTAQGAPAAPVDSPQVTLDGNLVLSAQGGVNYYAIGGGDATPYTGIITIVAPDGATTLPYSISVASGNHKATISLGTCALENSGACISISDYATLDAFKCALTATSTGSDAISGSGLVLDKTQLEGLYGNDWVNAEDCSGFASVRLTPASEASATAVTPQLVNDISFSIGDYYFGITGAVDFDESSITLDTIDANSSASALNKVIGNGYNLKNVGTYYVLAGTNQIILVIDGVQVGFQNMGAATTVDYESAGIQRQNIMRDQIISSVTDENFVNAIYGDGSGASLQYAGGRFYRIASDGLSTYDAFDHEFTGSSTKSTTETNLPYVYRAENIKGLIGTSPADSTTLVFALVFTVNQTQTATAAVTTTTNSTAIPATGDTSFSIITLLLIAAVCTSILALHRREN